MLGHADSGSGDYEGGGGRNVEGAAGVSAGAAGINQSVAAGAAGVEDAVGVKCERSGGSADGFREADNFFDCLAFHVQCNQELQRFVRRNTGR